jgi:hypothetical protein
MAAELHEVPVASDQPGHLPQIARLALRACRHLCPTMRATMSAMVSRMVPGDRSVAGFPVAPKGNAGDHAVASAMTDIMISAGGASIWMAPE